MLEQPILEVRKLTKIFTSGSFIARRLVVAVNEVSFGIPEKPVMIGLVGESGSGKSTIARLLLDLISPSSGEVHYRGKDISSLSKDDYKIYRREVQGIFQDPYSSVNPLRRVKYIFNMIKGMIASSEEDAHQLISSVIEDVGLNEDYLEKYPHQLSGGELQRLMIARTFAFRPKTIIADEPVSMLDASSRANILQIMFDMKDKYNTSFTYITHDLSTAYTICDEIIVLYRGRMVERGDPDSVVRNPKHPYTMSLTRSIPIPDPSKRWTDRIDISKLEVYTGEAKGCPFHNRCKDVSDECTKDEPPLVELERGHHVSCFKYY